MTKTQPDEDRIRAWREANNPFHGISTEEAARDLLDNAFRASEDQSRYYTYNDGRSLGTAAAFVQYAPEQCAEVMEHIFTELFDFETHGLRTLHNLTEVLNYAEGHQDEKEFWTDATIARAFELLDQIPYEEQTKFENDTAHAFQPYPFIIWNNIISTASRYFRKHGGDAGPSRERAISFITSWFDQTDFSDPSLRYGDILLLINHIGNDELISSHRAQIDQIALHFDSHSRAFYREHCPRLFPTEPGETPKPPSL